MLRMIVGRRSNNDGVHFFGMRNLLVSVGPKEELRCVNSGEAFRLLQLIEIGVSGIDLFRDQLDTAHANFDKLQQPKGFAAIDASQLFLGPDAYQQIAHSKEVDAIVVATPPYYHPQHLEAVVAAGKHVYLEKPVAVDVPGALRVIEIGKRAGGKLSLDVGFQIRDCPPFVELVRRI